VVPPGLWHGLDWDPDRPARHGYVHFGGAGLEVKPRLVPMTRQDPLDGLCAYLLWLGTGNPAGWQAATRRTLAFMVDVIGSAALPGPRPRRPPGLRAAIAHLRQVWAGPPFARVGVAQLAAAAHVSRSGLGRLVRRHYGCGAAAALEALRLSRTEPLLTRTDLTVEAIARECGFADASHLSHRFTAVYGMSPRAYRAAGTGVRSVLDDPGLRALAGQIWP